METVRPPAVAGQFYPAEPQRLRAMVRGFLDQAPISEMTKPKAIIAPHAGFIYSGPVAASAYAQLAKNAAGVHRVILIGPAHRVAIRGLAVGASTAYRTPLGVVPVDKEAVASLLEMPQVELRDDAHAAEHSLEVHLPFLQMILANFSIIPIVVGAAAMEEVRDVLDRLWGGDETIVIVSSDLSHYLPYQTARGRDQATADAIERLRPEEIGRTDACGRAGIQGLLLLAKEKGLSVHTVDLRSSGDTAGPKDQVVGYGSFLLA